MTWEIWRGDSRLKLPLIGDASVDAVVCDPPYELGFMGREWDSTGVAYDTDLWREVLRVLKPGGHLLAFGGTRTYHRMACAIEDAGFEIRDSIHWIYGSGFPKSHDVSKAIDKALGATRKVIGYDASRARPNRKYESGAIGNVGGNGKVSDRTDNGATLTEPATDAARDWQGWGTALKPAHEPIVVARKPLEGTVATNVLAHGVGALNVDGCRIPHASAEDLATSQQKNPGRSDLVTSGIYGADRPQQRVDANGRWPANVVLDEDAGRELDEQSGERKGGGVVRAVKQGFAGRSYMSGGRGCDESPGYFDTGGASRFFYCAKASKAERGEGNTHPTVKPIALMRWLVRLVTPPGGLVLDPFAGSGSTGVAAIREGCSFVGIERDVETARIARKRLRDEKGEARR